MTNEEVEKLFKVIFENAYSESSFLSPVSSYNIEVIVLLDGIAEIRGISKEENGRHYNDVADRLQKEKKSSTED